MRYLLLFLPLIICPISYAQDAPVLPPGTFTIYEGEDPELFGNTFSTHREGEQNFYHCELNNVQLAQAVAAMCPVVCEQPKISEFIDAVCGCEREVIPDCKPFSGDELWKGRSESSGCRNPVILMPQPFHDADIKVYGQDSNQEVATVGRETIANGNRWHWFLEQSCDSLRGKGGIDVFFSLQDGSTQCRSFEGDPCSRSSQPERECE